MSLPSFWRGAAVAAALALVVAPTRAAGEDKTPLTLAEAVTVAVEGNFDLALARIDRAATDADTDAARAGYDPALGLGAKAASRRAPNTSALSSQSINTTRSTGGEVSLGGQAVTGADYKLAATATRSESDSSLTALDPQYEVGYSLSVTQPLLKNAWTTPAGWRIVTALRLSDAARHGLEERMAAVVTAVHAAYWELAYRDGALAAQQEGLERAVDFLRRVEAQVEVGSLAPIQTVAAKATVAEAERLRIEAATARDRAQDALLKLLNPPADSPLWQGAAP
ncbi:MAG: TolC family protein, partial [Nitrospinae bacterium]|nr:TolC family protein [Nitrospinota bacterium]